MNLLIPLIIIVIIALYALFILLNKAYKNTNKYKNEELVHCTTNSYDPHADMMILGSTYGKYAFGTAEETKYEISDFTAGHKSFELDRLCFDRFFSESCNIKYIMINITTCSSLFFEDWTDYYYYDFLDKKQIGKYSVGRKLVRKYPLLKSPKSVIRIFKDKPGFNDIYELTSYNFCNADKEKALKDLCDNWIQMFGLKDLKSGNIGEKNEKTLKDNINQLDHIVSVCLEKNVVPVIVIPPFSDILNEYFGEAFIAATVGVIINFFKNKYGNEVKIYNEQFDNDFASPDLYLDDGFRLSKVGSRLLVNKIFSSLGL